MENENIILDENWFIKEISFDEGFLPFKWGIDWKIVFCGTKNMQDLLEFYIKDEKNAHRFKINCIVGNNWCGKSRTFEYLLEKKDKDNMVLLDDFFSLWNLFSYEENVNKYILLRKNLFHKNLSPIYNKALLSNYLINKEYWTNLFTIFSWKSFKESEIFFWWEGGSQKDLTRFFREDFLYGHIKEENKDNLWSEERLNFIKFEGSLRNIFHLSYNDLKVYIPTLFKIKDILENNKGKIGKYKLLLEFIIDRFLLSTFWQNKMSIFEKFINETSKGSSNYTFRDIKDYQECFKKLSEGFKIEDFLDFIYKIDINFWDKLYFIELISSIVLFSLDIKFDNIEDYKFSNFSAWEKISFLRFINIYSDIIYYNRANNKKSFIILIDEPDLHLHLDWQKKYIQKLIDVFSNLNTEIKIHFIIATHSPFILSDLPNESIILLEKWEKYTEIKKYKEKTFWANFIDLIRNWFFFNDKALMGSFAEEIIWQIANEERKNILNDVEEKESKKIKKMIWDDFLRDNLLYFKSK